MTGVERPPTPSWTSTRRPRPSTLDFVWSFSTLSETSCNMLYDRPSFSTKIQTTLVFPLRESWLPCEGDAPSAAQVRSCQLSWVAGCLTNPPLLNTNSHILQHGLSIRDHEHVCNLAPVVTANHYSPDPWNVVVSVQRIYSSFKYGLYVAHEVRAIIYRPLRHLIYLTEQ